VQESHEVRISRVHAREERLHFSERCPGFVDVPARELDPAAKIPAGGPVERQDGRIALDAGIVICLKRLQGEIVFALVRVDERRHPIRRPRKDGPPAFIDLTLDRQVLGQGLVPAAKEIIEKGLEPARPRSGARGRGVGDEGFERTVRLRVVLLKGVDVGQAFPGDVEVRPRGQDLLVLRDGRFELPHAHEDVRDRVPRVGIAGSERGISLERPDRSSEIPHLGIGERDVVQGQAEIRVEGQGFFIGRGGFGE
jgi:hypothetical protein